MKATTPHIQATGLITVPGHITGEAPSWSRLAIDRTIAVLGIGTAAHIMFGSLVTGRGGMVSKCGFVAITSCEDIEPRAIQHCRDGSGATKP